MKQKIINLIKKETKLKEKEIENLIEIPPSPDLGDYAFPCFTLSKKLHRSVYPKTQNEGAKKSPVEIAKELKKKIKLPIEIERIEVMGPYLNFFMNKKIFSETIVKEILEKKNNFGKSNIRGGKKIMIEFSQPNTHKAFHVGHIRGTSLGESLSRIAEFFGEKVIRANYSGDTGMHIAKWIWCYKKYHSKEKLKDDESWIASIYVDAVKKLSDNDKFQKEVDIINQKIENKSDNEINEIWKKTRKLSTDSWKRIYNELNTKFDVHYFESDFEKRGKEITNELLKNKIAKKSEGAVIIDFEKDKLGVLVFLRKDGTVLYAGKDLALAEEKVKKKLDGYIYVVADEQSLYLKQIFKTFELMNFNGRDKFKHVSFGLVKLPQGKMSSRTGDNILYSDFMKEIIDYTKKRINVKSPKLPKKELDNRALAVSIAAIKYSMLKQSANKIIVFKKDDALNFEGDTGPYLLYSYARASSILRKVTQAHSSLSKIQTKAKSKNKKLQIKKIDPQEFELAKKLSQFTEIVSNAYKNLNPSLIANYSYELAKLFSEFYHACPVINSENENFRLKLVESFRIILKNSLNLLGIEVLDEM
ncbi:MAG: arginine--tRNA ligase [Nanoarchaeota archaeon]|nr:arginine--tRNA ligase [Nanoarchaeota archaeon]